MRRHFASNLRPPISQHRRLSLESAPRGSLRICRRLHVNEPAFGRDLSHACPRSISPVRRCDGNCFVLQHRNVHNSGWVLFDGIITLILGFLIWAHWPSSSVWVIGTLIGVSLIFSGISRFMLSWLSGASPQHRCNRQLHDSGKWQTRPYAREPRPRTRRSLQRRFGPQDNTHLVRQRVVTQSHNFVGCRHSIQFH